jgi:tubulin-specific chaperone A
MASRKLRSAPGEQSAGTKLKTLLGVCKRMVKEVSSYEKEVVTNEARVQKMRDEGKDPYSIRKQEEVLQESYMMIPDSKARLENSIQDLEACLNECKEAEGLDQAVVDEAKALVAAQVA